MRLGFVLAESMLASSVLLPLEMWRAAAQTARARYRRGGRLEIALVASRDHVVPAMSGFDLAPTKVLAEAGIFDLVYLPALWRNPRAALRAAAPLQAWLQGQYAEAARIAAVGTGCCLLAAAGLLDGKVATTHWHYFDRFERDYPQVILKRDHFITQAGKIYCAASVNTLADVTVHLIEQFFGHRVARHVERNFSHEIRRPYEHYRYSEGDNLVHADEVILDAQMHLRTHFAERISISELADESDLSVRQFERRFRRATGSSPQAYLRRHRIEAAKNLLAATNLNIAEIALRVGYQDPGYFSCLFRRAMTVSPRDYRHTVRAKMFSLVD